MKLKCNAFETDELHVDEVGVDWDDLGTQRELDLVDLSVFEDGSYKGSIILSEANTRKLVDELQRLIEERENKKEV